MFYNLHQHREATCRRQKEAWEETIKTRLKREKSKGKIPIVIWGLEASPSYFGSSPSYENRIETTPGVSSRQYLLHKNYLYNDLPKDGNNYGVRIIKKWINKKYAPDTPKKKPSEYSYDSLIAQLSGTVDPKRVFKLPPEKTTENLDSLENPIHLVYDIFPQWHGLPVDRKLRQACFNEHYMCEKIPDFEIHLKLIESIFRRHSNGCTLGRIHFVWLATQQGKVTIGKMTKPVAHEKFFQCIKAFRKDVKLYYDPDGFFNGNKKLENFP